MKKAITYCQLFFLLVSTSLTAKAQLDELSNQQIKSFIQVWGLIKYKSPNGANGTFKADQTFLSLIDEVKVADQNKFSQLLKQLLAANPTPISKVKNTKGDLTKNIDHRWIKDKKFNPEIRAQLFALTQHRFTENAHYYMPKLDYEGKIPNEEVYADYKFDNEAMNLLALAKAWNAVAFLFPYKYQMDENWDKVLAEMVPTFRTINSRTLYERGVLQLETALNDTHAAGFLDQLKTSSQIFDLEYYPPFHYQIYQDQILVKNFFNDSLANTTKLKKGDLIVSINGQKAKEWLKRRSVLLPASNQSVKYRLLTKDNRFYAYAFGQVNERVLDVRVRRGSKYIQLKLDLLDRQDPSALNIINTYYNQKYAEEQLIKGYEDREGDIAVIRAGYFFDKDLPGEKGLAAFGDKLQAKKAIIFDMRKYPAAPGLFYYYLPMALGKPAFQFAQYFAADFNNPGVFKSRPGLETFLSKDVKPKIPLYKGKIVILTNEHTQSMGEWFTMMLSQINAKTTILGSETAGADGDLKRLNLPGGYQFLFTGIGIFHLNGKETQRIGIVPDIVYKPTLTEALSAKDAHLESAIQLINK